LNWDATKASAVILPVQKCDPNFGAHGRFNNMVSSAEDDEDAEEASAVSETGSSTPRTMTKTNSVALGQKTMVSKAASAGKNGLSNAFCFMLVQIVCVTVTVLYAVN
jgi:hypothetical protein